MARMVAVIMAALLVVAAFLSSPVEGKTIGYDRYFGKGNGTPKKKAPPALADPYKRPCHPGDKCRPLLDVQPLPEYERLPRKISLHGLQH